MQCNGFRSGWMEIVKLKNLWLFTTLLATLELKEVSKEKEIQALVTKL